MALAHAHTGAIRHDVLQQYNCYKSWMSMWCVWTKRKRESHRFPTEEIVFFNVCDVTFSDQNGTLSLSLFLPLCSFPPFARTIEHMVQSSFRYNDGKCCMIFIVRVVCVCEWTRWASERTRACIHLFIPTLDTDYWLMKEIKWWYECVTRVHIHPGLVMAFKCD